MKYRATRLEDLIRIRIDPSLPLAKPDTSIIDISLLGTVYTVDLAIQHFRRQRKSLILKASMSSYLDHRKGLLPVKIWGERVDALAQAHPMAPPDSSQHGISLEDACAAVLKIASDRSVNRPSLGVFQKDDCAGLELEQDDRPGGSILQKLQDMANPLEERNADTFLQAARAKGMN
ncbi:predicted protein [Uncinocarpus reesii 1704]|uniref:Uncharacterized protein n=1 Tax=Uncinocarpus reesii (strain UAMH 1704) TaxID=336963 RepID=C4JQ68_UNCRE|nr:uncharacterized protein UREG_03301 [Uncinocarpus reesii 1704]EEP78455.1 predicted protein [Uncinocarpus reesii 1704]